MHKIVAFLSFLLLFSGCDDFTKVLKSPNLEYKVTRAKEYMDKGKYANALTIYENVFPLVRGTNKGEEVYFNIAECNYKLNDFYSASYYYGNFEKTFPKSEKAENCAFLSAYCAYSISPEFDLDQSETNQAIESLQLFQLRYPKSTLIDSAQTLIQELLYKLEQKRFSAAKTYYKTGRYQAATIAFENIVKDYPNTGFAQEVYYLLFQSSFELAVNSVEDKKLNRLLEAEKNYFNFIDRFPQADQLRSVENQYKKVQTQIEKRKS